MVNSYFQKCVSGRVFGQNKCRVLLVLLQRRGWPRPTPALAVAQRQQGLHVPHQHNAWYKFLLAVAVLRVARRHVKDRVSNWRASSSSTSTGRSMTKRVTASRLEAIARPWYFFSKLAARRSVKTPAGRLLDVTVARRTSSAPPKTLEKKEEVPR